MINVNLSLVLSRRKAYNVDVEKCMIKVKDK